MEILWDPYHRLYGPRDLTDAPGQSEGIKPLAQCDSAELQKRISQINKLFINFNFDQGIETVYQEAKGRLDAADIRTLEKTYGAVPDSVNALFSQQSKAEKKKELVNLINAILAKAGYDPLEEMERSIEETTIETLSGRRVFIEAAKSIFYRIFKS